jgi:phospholipase/carboxylesterase
MFRANPENPFQGPHQKTRTVTKGETPENAKAAMVMVHGRGASAESILTLSDDLGYTEGFHFAAPQADQFTWYPYSFLEPTERNEPGISSGLQAIFNIFSDLEEKGIPKERIILLGFSQGACLASEFMARHPARYGGVVALSGGLIGDSVQADNYSGSLEGTPYFVGCSDIDPHIPVERVHDSAAIFEGLNASVTKKIYPGMGHIVNHDEIEEIKKVIQSVLSTN